MGIYDRPYFREESTYSAGFGRPAGGVSFGMPKPGRAVKRLLIINVVVYVAQFFMRGALEGLFAATAQQWWQLWRYVTFQFLHSTNYFWHIILNMLCLYMLGSPLEELWGERRFLAFYLTSGAVAGVAYVIMDHVLNFGGGGLIGASGGVYAILLACAILFPNFRIILLFFPVPIRLAVTIIFGIMVLTVLRTLSGGGVSPAFWSQVAHFGGVVGGAFWIWVVPRLQGTAGQVRMKMNQGAWDKKLHRQADEQKTINEVLRKVHDQGINSLTRKEKNTLAQATRRQREQGG